MLLLVIKDSEVVLQPIMRSTKKVLSWIYAEKGVGFDLRHSLWQYLLMIRAEGPGTLSVYI